MTKYTSNENCQSQSHSCTVGNSLWKFWQPRVYIIQGENPQRFYSKVITDNGRRRCRGHIRARFCSLELSLFQLTTNLTKQL